MFSRYSLILDYLFNTAFLIFVHPAKHHLLLQVLGNKGRSYTVTISRNSLCDCPDSKKAKKSRICKHCLFVFLKLGLGDSHLLHQVSFTQVSPLILHAGSESCYSFVSRGDRDPHHLMWDSLTRRHVMSDSLHVMWDRDPHHMMWDWDHVSPFLSPHIT